MSNSMRTSAVRLRLETLCITLCIENSFCKLVQVIYFACTEKEWGYIGGHIRIHPLYVRERNTHYICVLSELNRLLTYGYSSKRLPAETPAVAYTYLKSDYSGTPAPDFHGFPLFIPLKCHLIIFCDAASIKCIFAHQRSSPESGSGCSFERTDDLAGNPAAVVVTFLGSDLFTVHKAGIHLGCVEADIPGDWLEIGGRR